MNFEIVDGLENPEEIRALFEEYTAMLVACEPTFAGYLELQRYDRELDRLEEKYGGEGGRLYLARAGERAAGCVALHPLDEKRCELKRLYVRPAFRREGLGRLLSEKVIAAAREIGYGEMLLDTLPPLREAQRLYRTLGFREIGRYNDSPMAEAIYMCLTL